jgi:hypothetical protein
MNCSKLASQFCDRDQKTLETYIMAESATQLRPFVTATNELVFDGKIASCRQQSSQRTGKVFFINGFQCLDPFGSLEIITDTPLPLGPCKALFAFKIVARAETYQRDGETKVGQSRGQIQAEFVRLVES